MRAWIELYLNQRSIFTETSTVSGVWELIILNNTVSLLLLDFFSKHTWTCKFLDRIRQAQEKYPNRDPLWTYSTALEHADERGLTAWRGDWLESGLVLDWFDLSMVFKNDLPKVVSWFGFRTLQNIWKNHLSHYKFRCESPPVF